MIDDIGAQKQGTCYGIDITKKNKETDAFVDVTQYFKARNNDGRLVFLKDIKSAERS